MTPTEKYFKHLKESGNEFNQLEYEEYLTEGNIESIQQQIRELEFENMGIDYNVNRLKENNNKIKDLERRLKELHTDSVISEIKKLF